MNKILYILQYQEFAVTEFDLEKEEEELMNSMQSSMASVLWESTGATKAGFDLPIEEESLGDCLFLVVTDCRALATLSARFLRYLIVNSDPLGSLNLQFLEKPLLL